MWDSENEWGRVMKTKSGAVVLVEYKQTTHHFQQQATRLSHPATFCSPPQEVQNPEKKNPEKKKEKIRYDTIMKHYDIFWSKIIPHVTKKRKVLLTNRYKGQTLGVDVMSWLSERSDNFSEMIKAMSINRRNYQPLTAQAMIMKRHGLLLKAGVNPIYVFPGVRHPHQSVKKSTYHAVHHLLEFQEHAKQLSKTRYDDNYAGPIDATVRQEYMRHARRIGAGVDLQLIRYFAHWMIGQGMTCLQAPFEVAWQLVELELSGVTHGTISPDPLCVALGSRRMLVHTMYGDNNARAKWYDGEVDWVGMEHYKYDLSLYRNYLPEVVAMTGTSPYLSAPLDGKDSKHIMLHRLPRYFDALKKHQQEQQERQEQQGLNDDDGNADDDDNDDEYHHGTTRSSPLDDFWREQGLLDKWNGAYVRDFHRVVNLLRHCPVLRRTKNNKRKVIVAEPPPLAVTAAGAGTASPAPPPATAALSARRPPVHDPLPLLPPSGGDGGGGGTSAIMNGDSTNSETTTTTTSSATATTTEPMTSSTTSTTVQEERGNDNAAAAAEPEYTWELVPLHPLPVDEQRPWSDLIQFDPFQLLLPHTPDQYTAATTFAAALLPPDQTPTPIFGQWHEPHDLNVWCYHMRPMWFKKTILTDRERMLRERRKNKLKKLLKRQQEAATVW